MKTEKTIDTNTLIAEAASSEHKEAYKMLDRSLNYRIGVGARTAPPNHPSFFVEILIHLSRDDNKADLRILERSLACLKELQARNFKTVFQDDNCVSCEAQVSGEKLESEYDLTKSLVQSIFSET